MKNLMSRTRTLAATLLITCLSSFTHTHGANDEAKAFEKLRSQAWKETFSDPCTGKWQDQWFLDGEKAKVSNDGKAMSIDTAKGYAVLWTKRSFVGDMLVEYDFQRADKNNKGVNIIYLQATGDDQKGCVEDIAKWSEKRTKAAMSDYYQNMHTYHISYATGQTDYLRGRRYLPLANKGLKNTQLAGEYTKVGLFGDQQWMRVTVIKRERELWIEFKHLDRTKLCHFVNKEKPPIEKGRVGLRLMPGRLSKFKHFRISTLEETQKTAPVPVAPKKVETDKPQANWEIYVGKAGPTGWRCHVVHPDPKDHGPDGINVHDWDGDGDSDLFVNYEEGKYSRLYFNPGPDKTRQPWTNYIEFKHGKCEDSGIGDLDNDGDLDYVANGGWVYFNPGKDKVDEASAWTKMTLFDYERRVPTVTDVDGDGLNDLIVGAQEWYKQPKTDKHKAENWTKYVMGKNRWPMNCIMRDLDGDGDMDMVVPDRGREICWYVNPGKDKVTGPWERKTLHQHHEPMFMTVADVNGDQVEDVVITGGSLGKLARKLIVLLRTNKKGTPTFKEIIIEQPCGIFPKGVAVTDLDGDPKKSEILVIPKGGDLWTATYEGDPMEPKNWKAVPVSMPGAKTRQKMDNAWLGDLDGDGDLDVMTTDENGGWGVVWFENPARSK